VNTPPNETSGAGDDEVVVMPIEDSLDLHAFQPRDVLSVVTDYLEAKACSGQTCRRCWRAIPSSSASAMRPPRAAAGERRSWNYASRAEKRRLAGALGVAVAGLTLAAFDAWR
jgi:hypothetical protein